MKATYQKLFDILEPRERKLTVMVFFMMVLVAIVETLGIASVMPFMAVLANPEVIQTNSMISAVYEALGFRSEEAFLLFLGFFFLFMIVGSLAFRAFAFWVQVRFSQKRNHAWSCRLVNTYLNRGYEWFLNQHSGNLGSSILNEVTRVVDGSLFPAMQFISQALVAILLISLLLYIDPLIALSAAIVLSSAYIGTFLVAKKVLGRVGRNIQKSNRDRFKITQEMFSGIKDVKVYGLEGSFLTRFHEPSLSFAYHQILARIFTELPSFVMQALVFGGMMGILLYFVAFYGGIGTALPVISIFALAGYRLMPALQAMYRHISDMRVNEAVLDTVHRELAGCPVESVSDDYDYLNGAIEKLHLEDCIVMDDIHYSYPGADKKILNGVSLKIPVRSTIGLVGSTGSGKTTLVDILLGLLRPEHGSVLVDGIPLSGMSRVHWLRNIGYVPQQIFLADDTIAANIAFGIPPDKVNRDAVVRAAAIANIHSFVTEELKAGYDTMIGERGVRLSGGQRQRIGIARAMYHDPEILVLDEATSALDNMTEDAVMEAVHNLGHKKTIILIAHRLTTVMKSDKIVYLDQGRVIGEGSFDELISGHPRFKALATGVR